MNNLIKSNFKIFFKSIYLSLAFLLFFVLVNAYLIFSIYNLNIHKDAFYFLQYSQRISMIYFVFFTFITYEYLIKSKNENLLECLLVLNKGNLKLYFSKIIVLIIIILIMTLNIIVYNFIVYIGMNIYFEPYLVHIVLNNVLNIFLVSIFAMCLGSVISLYLKRFLAYAVMILLIILISPIFDYVPYILFMGYGINIYPFREILNILPPNLNWDGDLLYGLSIEPYRWNLLSSLISFMSFLLILKLNKKKHKYLNFIAIGLIILSLFNFYGYTKSGSIVKKDYNPKSYVAFDELYYSNDIQKEEKVSFKISAYSMNFTINRQLQSNVSIYLDEKKPLSTYKFTLYRNYKIEKIIGKNSEILEYKRDGDYFEITNPTNEKLEKITILYSGYSPVFYSNAQGVLLPGCFPYYPIEGYKRIYIKEESRFIPIIRDYNTKFEVTVKSNLNIYSNLQKSNNRFSGEAQELTLIGGFMKEKATKNNVFYELILSKMDKNRFSDINKTLKLYKELLSEPEEFNISNKKIFQSPAALSSKVIGNGTLMFRDHIFVNDLNKKELSLGLIKSTLPQDTKKRKINNVLFYYLEDKDSFTNNVKEWSKNNDPFFEIHSLFFKKINELGEAYVIKSTYKFLKDKNDERDSITFIKNLSN
ncbi:ABC transporter permease [Clostridium tagluense]|uniref:ABC transporter permease n=1 Tax=Clostridium tagluense TaxID=360422 RepID=UPI001C6F1982|nr:ABC transporter permease [Clostridium tagluense]MBW9159184.1 ABC transporter permease [Clostridium tagluense]WLC68440.1 ABC transporter permease [Clostridium tagluense]